ncbi:ABC-type proline/glycine betaine transport system, permease component [Hoeflea sp. IMCC20628]|uniref:ABC transporter permease n=1 Tax=Hoeflea sp. IMCC20628 TaxID=1620421 RepID=UPI00063BED92|nr:ABC transporter permease subunit [Hoeflea sp. IMCC20628]AKI01837.1 ABC-type proline/glycine betaine transport system, permease component [Hoeflea sp. IMCC20628]
MTLNRLKRTKLSEARPLGAQRNLGWLLVILFAFGCILVQDRIDWVAHYPDRLMLPIDGALNAVMDWVVANFEPLFKAITALLSAPMEWIRALLHVLPWSVFTFVMAAIAFGARGAGLAAFTALSLVYVQTVDLWFEAMNSFALVFISVPLAVLIGFGLGVWGFVSPRAQRAIYPMLDIAQTIPAFAYLLPILLLFGFGPVVGLVASILFAFPPMVRNTILGLERVPSDIIDAGLMSGATSFQSFRQVRFPSALRQILIGVNQTTMASLSMVIVASIIGGTADIGWEVLSTMRKAQFGDSLVAGVVIALMAMILDRITFGFAEREGATTIVKSRVQRYGFSLTVVAIALVLLALQTVFPILAHWPDGWHLDLAVPLDAAINWFVVSFKPALDSVKNTSLFVVMLPLKLGFDTAISPFTWGFELKYWHVAGYCALIGAAAFAAYRGGRFALAVWIVVLALVFYVGLTDMPWPAMLAILTYFGFCLGGFPLATGTALATGFLLVSGSWDKAMLTLYLCSLSVLAAFALGAVLGIVAAQNDWFSRMMRPVNDTLQTMPPFVLLIPIVMLFRIGEFTALFAIVFYALVPAFRYTEHGIRQVSTDAVEAATSLGATPSQLLFLVKLPLALPNIMLGLNQSIMAGIAMLVIAALVGTTGLGQEVYIGLSSGNFGQGFVAGIGMAIIAITADRFCQAWQRNYQNNLTKG